MAKGKKSFTADNPALQYISEPEETTVAAELAQDQRAAQAPEGYRLNPLYIETRSKRLQVVLQPSLYEKVKAAADRQGVKVNSYIHSVLEQAVDGE